MRTRRITVEQIIGIVREYGWTAKYLFSAVEQVLG